MAATDTRKPEHSVELIPTACDQTSAKANGDASATMTEQAAVLDQVAAPTSGSPHATSLEPPATKPPMGSLRKRLLLAVSMVVLAVLGYFLVPWITTALNTVSTDDAYINGHVTLVAPRVSGQVAKVLVDDNYRVKKGDLLVQLDKEPYQVQVATKKAVVTTAEADLAAAKAQVRGQIAQARADRFNLEHAVEDVDTQIAKLHVAVATLNSNRASLELAKQNLIRGETLAPIGAMSIEDLDKRREAAKVAEENVAVALQQIYAIRVGLGLPAQPPEGKALTDVPPELDQNFSAVRQALAKLLQSAAQLGIVPAKWDATPKEIIANFYKMDPQGNLDRIYAQLIPNAPAIKQAEAKLLQARSDLDQAELNLRYCDIVSEIDGVVTRRSVNPGNNVQAGQSLMAVRSLTEIWIDANFKETQLANLRIGQAVRCEVDMYGRKHEFKGRITGFTMGTGQTLSLLPPQNATGNFVKIVQRLPVRIELTNYYPDKVPLFVGLSVTPYVYYKERPTGPHAGEVLQPLADLPTGQTESKP